MMTTRPIDPFADDIQRYERSWTLVAGSRRVSFTKVDYRSSCTALRIIDHGAAPRRRSITAMVGAVLAVIAGATTLGLAVHADRAAAGSRYVLSIAVPPKLAAATPAKTVRKPVVAASVAAVVPTLAAEAMADAAPVSIVAHDVVPAVTRLTAMQPAVSAAMKTGQMQQWAKGDGSERGFVVAGPSDGGCRTLSVLIKRGGDNEVKSLRECGATTAATAPADDGAMAAEDASIAQ